MSATAESDALHRRVRAFIRGSLGGDRGGFDELALAIARFQVRDVPAMARLAAARGVDLERATDAGAIPAVPCDAFRLTRVAAHPQELDVRTFRTSGTSDVVRGEHPFRTVETYELSALAWGRAMLFPDAPEAPALSSLVLAPPLDEAVDSSLAFMIDRFTRALGGPATWHVRAGRDGALTIDIEGLAGACAEARRRGGPAVVFGTSFAFVHLSEGRAGDDLSLPAGSRAMQTGGFKGRSREVSPAEMRRLIGATFDLPPARIVGEYGMTELSSQLYDGPLAGGSPDVYRAPPWLRVTAVDPATLAALPDGEIGLARVVDLANVDSAVAVQTSDRVRVGPAGVELLGREPGATPRGCSLAIDQILGGRA